jgi:hypothetical protein
MVRIRPNPVRTVALAFERALYGHAIPDGTTMTARTEKHRCARATPWPTTAHRVSSTAT